VTFRDILLDVQGERRILPPSIERQFSHDDLDAVQHRRTDAAVRRPSATLTRIQELAQQICVRTVDLDAVEPSSFDAAGRGRKIVHDAAYLVRCQYASFLVGIVPRRDRLNSAQFRSCSETSVMQLDRRRSPFCPQYVGESTESRQETVVPHCKLTRTCLARPYDMGCTGDHHPEPARCTRLQLPQLVLVQAAVGIALLIRQGSQRQAIGASVVRGAAPTYLPFA